MPSGNLASRDSFLKAVGGNRPYHLPTGVPYFRSDTASVASFRPRVNSDRLRLSSFK